METIKRERVVEELVQGQECATQLQLVLREPPANRLISADELVGRILRSFTHSLSVLAVPVAGESSSAGEVVSAAAQGSGCSWGDRSESGESSRRSTSGSGATPGRRGCYKRKKKSETWTIISPVSEDSYSWRKYGQKEILNSKFPRSYFRCTRKYEKECKATKQVQKLDEGPHNMVRTTYIGHHTCKEDPPLISDALHGPTDTPTGPEETAAVLLHHPLMIKAEYTNFDELMADDVSCLDTEFGNNNNNNNINSSLWSDLGTSDLVEAFGFDQCEFRLGEEEDEFFRLGKLY